MYERKMSGSSKYYPNNWEQYKEMDDSLFHRLTLPEMLIVAGRDPELPSSVCCILREYDKKKGKVKEKAYQSVGAAENRIIKLSNDPDFSFVYVDHAKMSWK